MSAEADAWFAERRRWSDRGPDVRYDADGPPILISPNMREVYAFAHDLGNFTEPDGYIIAGSFDDAYEELAEHVLAIRGPCDHGGDITDEQRWDGGPCDCDSTSSGQWVWLVDYHLHQLKLSPEQFCLAFPTQTGQETM